MNAGVASAVAPAAVTTAASAAASIGDDKYNANLMLAKIGEVNFRLGKTADSQSGLRPHGCEESLKARRRKLAEDLAV